MPSLELVRSCVSKEHTEGISVAGLLFDGWWIAICPVSIEEHPFPVRHFWGMSSWGKGQYSHHLVSATPSMHQRGSSIKQSETLFGGRDMNTLSLF